MRTKNLAFVGCLILLHTLSACEKKTTSISLDDGLIAYWPMDASGTDQTQGSNHGTLYGVSGGEDRFGKPQGALYFDGISYMKCKKPGPGGNPVFSVSFWLKTSTTRVGHIISWGNNGLTGQDMRVMVNGNLGCAVGLDTYNNASYYTSTIPTNAWDHYVVLYDGKVGANTNSTTIYKNGSKLLTKCFTQNIGTTNVGANNPITFGRYHGTIQTGYYSGFLDDVRIYDRLLSEREIGYLSSH